MKSNWHRHPILLGSILFARCTLHTNLIDANVRRVRGSVLFGAKKPIESRLKLIHWLADDMPGDATPVPHHFA